MEEMDIVFKRKTKWKRIFFGCFSVIFIMAAGIGIFSAVVHANRSGNDEFDGEVDSLSSVSSISAICGQTDYRDICVSGLSSATGPEPGGSHTKQLIRKSIVLTIVEVARVLNLTARIASAHQNSSDFRQLEALADCQELLQNEIDELSNCLSDVSGNSLRELPNRVDEMRNRLGAAMSYQSSCIDGLTHTQVRSVMENELVNATKLTSNALAIVTGVASILTDLQVDAKSSRLLAEEAIEKLQYDGNKASTEYPSWFELKDRKLLSLHDSGKVTPNAVVAKDGSGQFKEISAALAAMPADYNGRYVIYVKEGIYEEQVIVTKKMKNVLMYGDGPRKTIVTGGKNYVDGTTTYRTATFAVNGDGFLAKSMGFQNTAGAAKNQAVALRVQSDRSAFFNCQVEGFQNTLYVQAHRQFYRDCVISGTIDFIFGDAAVVLQNCSILVRRPLDHQHNTVTAQGRPDKRSPTGIVIQNCQIMPDAELSSVMSRFRSYLGRPLKKYARTVIMESTIGEVIQPRGWTPLDGRFALATLLFAEYENRGPGASTTGRVKWKGHRLITSRTEALQYTASNFIQGRLWLRRTHIPYALGLLN
ncbi:Pectinesterase 3 [Nymphaea thermarum]|nr:Pectinesterase 3 [Nymphaea thermarum]